MQTPRDARKRDALGRSTTVASVLSALAFVPSPPLLLAELAGSATGELDDLRAAVREVCDDLGQSCHDWIGVGVGATTTWIDGDAAGTYAGFGADVVVGLAPDRGPVDRAMELAALTVGLLRGQAVPQWSVPVQLVARNASVQDVAAVALDLRGRVDAAPGPVGLLVVGDGATTLTDKAPGAFDDRAEAVQHAIDDALGRADVDALASLDAALCDALGVDGRVAWQVAATLVGPARVLPHSLFRGAPYGVGYHVASWSL